MNDSPRPSGTDDVSNDGRASIAIVVLSVVLIAFLITRIV